MKNCEQLPCERCSEKLRCITKKRYYLNGKINFTIKGVDREKNIHELRELKNGVKKALESNLIPKHEKFEKLDIKVW